MNNKVYKEKENTKLKESSYIQKCTILKHNMNYIYQTE